MSKKLDTLRAELKRIVKDNDAYLTDDDYNDALARAVRVFSSRTPQVSIADKSGDGSTFLWAVPTDWVAGWSGIVEVVYPFSSTTQTPIDPLEPDQYGLIEKASGDFYFLLKEATPGSGEVARFRYTTYQSITDTTSTITASNDEDSILFYAASQCFRRMAARTIAVSDPTLGADTVAYQPRESQYAALADYYEKLSGLIDYANKPLSGALVYSDFDTKDPEGYQLLTHFRRQR